MRIFDCFTFFNEVDVLELRLETLADVVDVFVLVEGRRTFTNLPKELIFEKNKVRFARFLPKIRYVVVDDFPSHLETAFARENFQRNAIEKGLYDADDEDVVLISDCDEIPRPECVKKYAGRPGIIAFDCAYYCYFLNLRNCTRPFFPLGTRMLTYGTFKQEDQIDGCRFDKDLIVELNRGPTINRVRYARNVVLVSKAGWHFSFLGGAERAVEKMQSYSDLELMKNYKVDLSHVCDCIARGIDLFGRGECFLPEVVDSRFPLPVQEKREQYARFLIDDRVSPMQRIRACGLRTAFALKRITNSRYLKKKFRLIKESVS